MKKLLTIIGVSLIMFSLTGCYDAQIANITAIAQPHTVICWSGGKVSYKGKSTGKVTTLSNSDGWQFMEQKSGKLVRISGDCIIKVD